MQCLYSMFIVFLLVIKPSLYTGDLFNFIGFLLFHTLLKKGLINYNKKSLNKNFL